MLEKKAYEILKKRANGLSKEKAYNILAFMGLKPMISKTIFQLMNYQKREPLKSGFDGIQTHDKIFYSFQNVREESL